ncbi:MAG TPA: peptidoglycan DD-metalloendopeptidase family protein, partial [Candidatus Binatia bacterium]|nr:peptidoglycan DD-metalloendopeptidase family protein [Candidatus Binatia bacterium]
VEVDQEATAAASAAEAIEPAAKVVAETASVAPTAGKADQHRHPLGFDPLREPALTGAAPTKGIAAVIPKDEEHTVRFVREVAHEVRSGETLSTVLSRHGVSSADVTKWLAAVKKQYNPNRIYAGQTISLLIDMPEKRLRRVKFEIGREGSLVIEDTGSTLVAKQKAPPHESTVRVVEGEITSSLYAVANAKGVPDRIISDAAEVLGWEINLGRDLQRGARFRLAYEETMRVDTRESWAGRLLAIELVNQGKHYEGFHFATADGKTSGYFNRKGQGLGRAFLRYPVAFSRISSQFSTSRYHPVLKRSRPHYGVDFAAPTGTPVKAAADGVVTTAGWQGGNGRFVKIRHDKQYESGYSHLSRIASGMRSGAKVKQGQVIGYVGSTGLATGPHLHFAMYSYGKYVDPLKTALPRTMPLAGSSLASFKSQLSKVEKVYAANGMGAFGAPKVATAAAPATRR